MRQEGSMRPVRCTPLALAALAVALAAVLPTAARAQEDAPGRGTDAHAAERALRGHVSYVAGYRRGGDGWGDAARHQLVFGGIDVDASRPGWPVSPMLRAAVSYTPHVPPGSREGAGNAGSYELGVGVRRDVLSVRARRMRAWVGAGIAVVGVGIQSADRERETQDAEWQDNGTTIGPVIEAGMLRGLGRTLHAGWTVSWSRGRVRAHDARLDAGGWQFGALFGTRWGPGRDGRG